jgi:hypothetical protein
VSNGVLTVWSGFVYRFGGTSAGSLSSYAFHDVTSGNNSITLDDANGNPVTIQGYTAKKGWDAVTGWGSPIVSHFVPLLSSISYLHGAEFVSQFATLK